MVYSAKSDTSTISQFTRRKSITINTNGTSTPALYQTKLTILYSPGMNADFSDIRFNTKSGTYIDYWIESKVDSDTAYVWVELIDVIADPGSDSIWMYYGNAAVSDGSSNSNTFVAADASTFTNSGTGITVNGDGTVSFNTPSLYLYKTIPAITDFEMRFGLNVTTWSHLSIGMSSFTGIQDGTASSISMRYSTPGGTPSLMLQQNEASPYVQVLNNPATSTWYYVKIQRIGTTAYMYIYSDSTYTTLINSGSLTVGTTAFTNVWYITRTGAGVVASVGTVNKKLFVRKYIAIEPTATLGTAQHQRRIPTFL